MQSPVVNEVAWALEKAGVASLRFDWRGIGASGGRPSGRHEDADADYAAALDHLEETVNGEIRAAIVRRRGCAARRGRARAPRGLVCLAAAGSIPPRSRAVGRVLIVTGEVDTIAPPAALGALAERARRGHAVIPTDHFFGVGLAARRAAGWLAGGALSRAPSGACS
jgi:alpha/beta superfamily hydrolase